MEVIMGFKLKEFRAYVKELIGDSTQSEFAKKCDISPEHLSRMLRSENPNRPSKTTLRKLAGKSETAYEELLSICGYKGTDLSFLTDSPEDKVRIRMEEIRGGFTDMTKGVHTYASLNEFFEEYVMLYDTKDVKFHCGKKNEYDKDGHFGAEYILPVQAVYYVFGYKALIYSSVYFSETKGGRIIVLDACFDGASVLDAFPCDDNEVEEKVKELPFVYLLQQDPTTEERLLEAIFGNERDRRVISSVIGFGLGFEKDKINEETLAGFLLAHADSVDVEVKEELCRVENGEDPRVVFEDYESSNDCGDGALSLVAEIIRNETGIGFTYYEGVMPSEGSKSPVLDGILIEREYYKHYELEDMKEVSSKYARELGLSSYGEYIVYVYDSLEGNMMFTVDKGEDEDGED